MRGKALAYCLFASIFVGAGSSFYVGAVEDPFILDRTDNNENADFRVSGNKAKVVDSDGKVGSYGEGSDFANGEKSGNDESLQSSVEEQKENIGDFAECEELLLDDKNVIGTERIGGKYVGGVKGTFYLGENNKNAYTDNFKLSKEEAETEYLQIGGCVLVGAKSWFALW